MVQLRRSTRSKSTTHGDSNSQESSSSNMASVESDIITKVSKTVRPESDDNAEEEELQEEEKEEEEEEDPFDDPSSSSSEEEDPKDDDYLDTATARKRKRAIKSSSNKKKNQTQGRKVKKQKTSNVKTTSLGNSNIPLTEEEQREYLQNAKEIKHSELFEALSESDDISIDEFLRSWLEKYDKQRDSLLEEFINLLLDCCGALIHVEEHDVHNNESATDTLTELQLLFERQKVHEFHLMISKTNKKASPYQPLYPNFIEFMSRFLDVANDMQLLYFESSEDTNELIMGPLVVDILTWLSAFSVAKIRCFRYIATLSLYQFQDFLSAHIVDLERNYLSKFAKQLTLEKKKKRPNKLVIEKLESNLTETQNSKIITENIIENIIKICFVHRFKDVDEIIRQESVLHLSTWVKNYPEYFMKVTFLKYFGWLLSDTSSIVRSQVLKVLPTILGTSRTKKLDNAAVRQFFERFRQRILDIALKDVDLEVRLHATNILTEVVSLGYLEDDEILAISSLIFDDNDIKVSSHSKNSRFLSAIAKFLAKVTTESCNDLLTNNETLDENLSPIGTAIIVKVGVIMRILSNSFLFYIQDLDELAQVEKLHILYQAAEFLSPYFGDQIVTICKILGDDNVYEKVFNAIGSLNKENGQVESEDQTTIDSSNSFDNTPLLPTNKNNIILYLTVLNGLCHGTSSLKNQQKFNVAKSVLPHFHNLMKNLAIQSTDILPPLLGIFNIFVIEDWIDAGSESDLLEIVKMISKLVNECVLPSVEPEDKFFGPLFATIEKVKTFKNNDIDTLWVNEITNTKLHLEKFLSDKTNVSTDKDINEMTETIFSMYINKLILVGKEYPIEFNHDLLILLFKNFFSLFPNYYKQFNTDVVEHITFKLPVLLVSWQLQKWADISTKSSLLNNKDAHHSGDEDENMNDSTNRSTETSNTRIGETLNTIETILDQLCNILITIKYTSSLNIHDVFKLKWELSNSIIDIAVSLKCFELQLPVTNKDWKMLIVEKFDPYLPEAINIPLKEVFLYLESVYAKEKDLQLERVGDEDVALNDLTDSVYINEPEKELLLFVIRLKGAMKLGLVNEDMNNRLKLNEELFSTLYQNVINDEIYDNGSTENPHEGEQSGRNLNNVTTPESIELPNQTTSRANTAEFDPLEDSSVPPPSNGSKSRNTIGDSAELGIIEENSHEESVQSTRENSTTSNTEQLDPLEDSSEI